MNQNRLVFSGMASFNAKNTLNEENTFNAENTLNEEKGPKSEKAPKSETIAAIATAQGVAGIGIIRISGKEAAPVLESIFQAAGGIKPSEKPRYLCYGKIRRQEDGQILDRCMAVFMPAPHSYTGEDVAELHCHGGKKLLEAVLLLCLEQGARLATAGEFTLRAFLNGKMDLTQAEAVADILAAKTPRALDLAQRQLAGAISAQALELEEGILSLLAQITVGVDFPDDEDAVNAGDILPPLEKLLQQTSQLLAGGKLGLAYREGAKVVLAGAVNSGKSSLMNRLLGRERAIVTAEAGTTRDIIEEEADICGIPICLTDTAGLRERAQVCEAEKQGIDRSYAHMEAAAVILAVADISQPPTEEFISLLAKENPVIPVLNKCDLTDNSLPSAWQNICKQAGRKTCLISAKTGAGIEELRQQIATACAGGISPEQLSPLLNNVRHMEALQQTHTALLNAQTTLLNDFPPDIAAVDLEEAAAALARLTGKVVSEEVLAEIFSRFCVGK